MFGLGEGLGGLKGLEIRPVLTAIQSTGQVRVSAL